MSPDRLKSHRSQLPIINRCRINQIRDDSSKSGDLRETGDLCGFPWEICVLCTNRLIL